MTDCPAPPAGINGGICNSRNGHAPAEAYWSINCAAQQRLGLSCNVMNGLWSSTNHIKVRLHDKYEVEDWREGRFGGRWVGIQEVWEGAFDKIWKRDEIKSKIKISKLLPSLLLYLLLFLVTDEKRRGSFQFLINPLWASIYCLVFVWPVVWAERFLCFSFTSHSSGVLPKAAFRCCNHLSISERLPVMTHALSVLGWMDSSTVNSE